jgi:hypothetical protein
MSYSVTQRERPLPLGDLKKRVHEVTIESYEPGGESFTADDAMMRRLSWVNPSVVSGDDLRVKYDEENQRLRLIDAGAKSEATAGTSTELVVIAVGA